MGKYIALGIYFIVLAIITYFSSRRKAIDDFLIASRAVGWQRLGIAIFASLFSSYNLVLGITFSYLFGPWVAVVYFGVFLAFIGIYFLVKNQNREIIVGKKFITIIDYFADRFGIKNANVLNLALMLVLFIFIALQFYINASVFSNIFGWGKYTSAILVGAVVLIYTLIGGLKVSILTDVFQGILMLLIGGMVFLVDTSKITFTTIQPLLTNKTIIIGALSLAASQFLTLLVYPELWQRVYASRSLKDLKKGFIFCSLLLFVIIIPQILIGMSAKAMGGIQNPSNIFYDVLKTASPTWYLPILSVALLAAFMSTLDAALFAIGAQLGKYAFWFKSVESSEKKDEATVRKTRIAVTAVTILALILSLFFSNFLSAAFQLISLLTVISVVVLSSLLLKTSKQETFIGTIVAIAIFVYMAFSGVITDVPLTTLYPSGLALSFMLLQNFSIRLYTRLHRPKS